jgi:hypothetical protein
MGIGHLAVGFASKRLAPRVSLGLLLFAPLFIDALFMIFVAVGLEHARIVPGITAANPLDLYDLPISHSLVGAVGWAALFAGVYFAARRRLGEAAVLFVGVVSHWVLDVVAHRPDMPVLPSGPFLGLGLWRSVTATILVEGAMVIGAVVVYARVTRSRDRFGRIGLWALLALLLVIHLGAYLGPPPPSVRAMLITGPFFALPVVAAHYIDKHRVPSPAR